MGRKIMNLLQEIKELAGCTDFDVVMDAGGYISLYDVHVGHYENLKELHPNDIKKRMKYPPWTPKKEE